MDRAISTSTQNRRQRRTWLLGAGALLLLAACLFAFRNVLKPTLERNAILTAKVETGDVEASLTAAGVVIPAHEAVITSPIQSTIRQVMVAVGSKVLPGQTILELDKEQTTSALAKLQDEQQQNRNKNSQLQLSLEKALNDLRSQEQVQLVRVRSFAEDWGWYLRERAPGRVKPENSAARAEAAR
jgi:HlyD family secretion protein